MTLYGILKQDSEIFFKMRDILSKLKEGKSVEVPIYDFNLHARVAETKRIYGATVIVFEGIMAFCDEYLRDIMDVKGF